MLTLERCLQNLSDDPMTEENWNYIKDSLARFYSFFWTDPDKFQKGVWWLVTECFPPLVKETERLRLEWARLQADARLGRMVRRMPQGASLHHDHLSIEQWSYDCMVRKVSGEATLPEDALATGGVSDE